MDRPTRILLMKDLKPLTRLVALLLETSEGPLTRPVIAEKLGISARSVAYSVGELKETEAFEITSSFYGLALFHKVRVSLHADGVSSSKLLVSSKPPPVKGANPASKGANPASRGANPASKGASSASQERASHHLSHLENNTHLSSEEPSPYFDDGKMDRVHLLTDEKLSAYLAKWWRALAARSPKISHSVALSSPVLASARVCLREVPDALQKLPKALFPLAEWVHGPLRFDTFFGSVANLKAALIGKYQSQDRGEVKEYTETEAVADFESLQSELNERMRGA